MKRPLIAAALLLAIAGAAHAAPSPIAAAVADASRPAADRATDAIRKPAETLAFAGVKPGQSVVEFFPGGGYFTRMISGVVGPKGHVYGVENAKWKSSAKADEALAGDGAHANVTMQVQPFGAFDLPAKVDLAWVTQNYHDLKIAEYGVVGTADFNRRVFAALKPGGSYLILDHEAPAGTTVEGVTRLHRIEKAQVIREVQAAGFKLAAQGDFLRAPADDHTLSIFDKAIQGHTDQYALRFVEPRA